MRCTHGFGTDEFKKEREAVVVPAMWPNSHRRSAQTRSVHGCVRIFWLMQPETLV